MVGGGGVAHGGSAGLELCDDQRGPLLVLVGEVGVLVVNFVVEHILADVEALASLRSTQQRVRTLAVDPLSSCVARRISHAP